MAGLSKRIFAYRCIAIFLIEAMIFNICIYAGEKQASDIESCVPERYGSIQMLHTNPDSDTWVVHIQDAHCNPEAQRNIAAILQRLQRKELLDIVFMEGAEGAVDTAPLASYPDVSARNVVSEYLLNSADISGAEYFSVLSSSDTPLYGIEDGAVYNSNLQALLDVLAVKDTANTIIDDLESRIDRLKGTVYSPALADFDRQHSAYKAHILPVTEYLEVLAPAVADSLDLYPNCKKILDIEQTKNTIDFTALEDETRDLLDTLSVTLSKDELAALFRVNLAFKIGDLSAHRFYAHIIDVMIKQSISSDQFANLCAYAELIDLYSTIDHGSVSQEIAAMEAEFVDTLVTSGDERNLYDLARRLNLMRDYFNLTISQSDGKYMLANRQQFAASELSSLLQPIDAGVNAYRDTLHQLDLFWDTAQKFYDLAIKRDSILIENTLAKMTSDGSSHGALITGGFHTRGIVEMLKSKGVNFAVVIPGITRAVDSGLYWSVITHKRSAVEQFIESAINSLAHSSWLSEKPLGFDSTRRQVKLSKAITLFLTESADNLYLENPYKDPHILLEELNRLISGYDARQIEITDFRVVDGFRLYRLNINGHEMFYYFEDESTRKTALRDALLGDVHAILEKEIKLGEKKSVTAFKEEIMQVLAPRFDQLESGFQPSVKPEQARAVKNRQIRAAILDYAFMPERVSLKQMFKDISLKHGFDLNFRSEFQPIIDELIEEGWLAGTFSSVDAKFSLSEDVRLAYHLSIMAENDNYFPELSQLLSYHHMPFADNNISSLFIEAGMPMEAILSFIRQLEHNAFSGAHETEFTYTAQNGDEYEGRIFANQNNFKYFRMIRKHGNQPQADTHAQLAALEQERTALLSSQQMVQINRDDNTVLALSQEKGKYVVSLVQLGDEQHPDTILFQESLPRDDQLQHKLVGIIQGLAEQFSEYLQLQGLVVIADNKAQFINLEDIREGVLNDILPDRKLADLLLEELGRMNASVAGSENNAPLESLTAIDDEDMGEADIVKRLSGYSANALLEVARTTRNSAFLRVLAKNAIYSQPDSKVKVGDFATHRIKSVLIDNQFTPTDSLLDMVQDTVFFEYLLGRNPDRIKALIDHPQAMAELVEMIADHIEERAEHLDQAVVDDLKITIIRSPLADDTLMMRYFQDSSLNVRLAVAQSSISDIMVDDPVEDVKIEVAKNPSTSITNLYRFAEPGESKAVKLALASNNIIDKHIVEKLLADKDEKIVVQLANTLTQADIPMFNDQPEVLNDLLLQMITDYGDAVDSAIAKAEIPLSSAVLEVLATQGQRVRELVAKRNDLPDALIKSLYASNDPTVKRLLILNSRVSLPNSEYLKAIKKSKEEPNGWRIRLAISQRSKLSDQVMEELAIDDNVKVRANLALRPDLPEELMDDLARDPFAYVRGFLAVNINLSKAIVRRLSRDEQELSNGLLDDSGELIEGFKLQEIRMLRENRETVATRLTTNKKLLDDQKLLDYFIHDYRYHHRILELLIKHRNEALDNYQDAEYHKAYHRLKRFVDSPYALYGTKYQYACALYMIRDFDQAMEYFQKSAQERNNVCAQIALDVYNRNGEVPESLLFMPIPVQTILQNMHHARSMNETDLPAIMDFIDYMSQPIPDEQKPDYLTDANRWSDLFETEAIEQVAALTLYTLRDVMDKGFIDWPQALGILKDVFTQVADYRTLPREWHSIKSTMWEKIISMSNLHQSVKDEMLGQPRDETEFFLRGGVRGVIKFKDYQQFRSDIVMDNIPSYLREDVAKSVWSEFIDLTEDMLFSEPQYFKRLSLARQRGSYGGFDNALKISFALSGGNYLYGVGDINKIVRSEGGHSIANGIFHNLGMNQAVDELQDRSSVLRFPKDLDDPKRASAVAAIYRAHDTLLMELYGVLMSNNDMDDIIASLNSFKGTSLVEDFAVRNALVALEDQSSDPLAQRFIGEALYYMYRNEPSLDVIDEALPGVIAQIKTIKDEIDTFPWDVRIFFDGGCYVNTYKQPFPILAPPLDVVVGTKAVEKLSQSTQDAHYTGEWLHYLLRMRIREMVGQNQIDPANIHRFFRTSVIYMSHVIQQGELFSRIQTVLKGFSSGYSPAAMMRLFYMLNDPQLRSVHPEMRKDLQEIHKLAMDVVKLDRTNLISFLQRNVIRNHIDRSHELHPLVVRSSIQILERLNAGKINAAIFSTINLIAELYKSDDPQCKEYARKLESTVLPLEDQHMVQIAGSLNSFLTKFADARSQSARNLNEVVEVIRGLDADTVFDTIQQRQVQAAEPEKVLLKEVGRQITNNLFLTGDVSFTQFVGLITEFYTKDYQRIKGSSSAFRMQDYMPGYRNFWKNIVGHLMPVMTGLGLGDLMESLQTRARQGKQTPAQQTVTGGKLYSFAPVMFLGPMLGISFAQLVIGGLVMFGASASLYGIVRLAKYLINRSRTAVNRQVVDGMTETPDALPATEEITLPIPVVTDDIEQSPKSIIFDYDSLLNSWDPLWAFSYTLAENDPQDAMIYVYSATESRETIVHRLAAFDVDIARIEIISADDHAIVGENFDLEFFLSTNYGVRPAGLIVAAAPQSDLRSQLKSARELYFDVPVQDDAGSMIVAFSSLFAVAQTGMLSAHMIIRDMPESSPAYSWFAQMSEQKEVTLGDLLAYSETAQMPVGMSDIAGMSFGMPQDATNMPDVAPRLNVTMPSQALESSL